MTTDVAERSETQTATETVETGTTEARQGTDAGLEAQTGTGSEQTTTEGSQSPTGRERRIAALEEAEREEIRQSARQETLDEIRQTGTKQQQEQAKARLKELYPATIREVEAIHNRAIDEGRPLTTEEAARVKNVFNSYNLTAWEGAASEASDLIRDTIYGMLPKDAQAEMTSRTTADTSLPNYFTAALELAAPHSKWAKGLDLEVAEKASPKLRKQLAERDLRNHDEGYDEGLTAPPGTSPDGGRGAGRTAPGNKTYVQLEDAYGKGELGAEETKLYLKMRSERATRR
jgi:hypothetical protein